MKLVPVSATDITSLALIQILIFLIAVGVCAYTYSSHLSEDDEN